MGQNGGAGKADRVGGGVAMGRTDGGAVKTDGATTEADGTAVKADGATTKTDGSSADAGDGGASDGVAGVACMCDAAHGGDGMPDDRLDHGLHDLSGLHDGRHLVGHGHGHGPLHRHRPGHRHRHVHLLVDDLGHGAGDVRLDAGDGTALRNHRGLPHQSGQTGRQTVPRQGRRNSGVQVAVDGSSRSGSDRGGNSRGGNSGRGGNGGGDSGGGVAETSGMEGSGAVRMRPADGRSDGDSGNSGGGVADTSRVNGRSAVCVCSADVRSGVAMCDAYGRRGGGVAISQTNAVGTGGVAMCQAEPCSSVQESAVRHGSGERHQRTEHHLRGKTPPNGSLAPAEQR